MHISAHTTEIFTQAAPHIRQCDTSAHSIFSLHEIYFLLPELTICAHLCSMLHLLCYHMRLPPPSSLCNRVFVYLVAELLKKLSINKIFRSRPWYGK